MRAWRWNAMLRKKDKVLVTDEERTVLILALNELRNKLITEGKYTDAVDELILSNAASFIAVHNHPSGSTTPSYEDIETTKRLKACGDLLDIRMLDHIIVAAESGDTFSFRENGLMDHTRSRDPWER
jgi:DNA repair protein RadC